MKKYYGSILLLITTFIWGIAFVAQSAAADNIEPFTFNASRALLACVFLGLVWSIRALLTKRKEKVFFTAQRKKYLTRSVFAGVLCGVFLFIGTNFQQFGITAYPTGVASSGRAGFITATYVVMIAVVSWIKDRKMNPLLLIAVVGCLGGMYLLCLSRGLGQIYLGDILVFCCAIGFTVYIMVVDHFTDTDGVTLSFVQFLVVGALSAIGMAIFEHPDFSALAKAWLPILYSGILSSGVGYTFQVIGQKYTEPTKASIIMSLESVFAALAGWVILSERLSAVELIGCALVFASVILAQLPPPKLKK